MPSSSKTRESREIVAGRMLEVGFQGFERLDLRTITLLESAGAIRKRRHDIKVPLAVIEALSSNPGTGGAISQIGPLFFTDIEEERAFVNVAELLLSRSSSIREVAVRHFLALSKDALTDHSRTTLDEFAAKVRSKNWRDAALSINEALESDFRLQIAGLDQALEVRHEDAAKNYLERVIMPTEETLDSMGRSFKAPTLRIRRKGVALEVFLTRYLCRAGFVPLGGRRSAGAVFAAWLESNHGVKTGDVWERVWRWADDEASAIRTYHACAIFLENAGLVPKHHLKKLWNRVDSLVDGESNPWGLLPTLAKHYLLLLEIKFAGGDSEKIAAAAWQMAAIAAASVDKAMQSPGLKAASLDLQEIRNTQMIWQLTRPRSTQTQLRYATLSDPCIWVLSLLCTIGANGTNLETPRDASHRKNLRRRLEQRLLAGYPLRPSRRGKYAFEHWDGLSSNHWSNILSRSQDQRSTALIDIFRTFTDLEGIRNLLEHSLETEGALRWLAFLTLRSAAYLDKFPDELVREVFLEEGKESLLTLDEVAFFLLVDAVQEFQSVAQDPDWRWQPAHSLVSLVSDCDGEQAERFLDGVVLLSASSQLVSGLKRLKLTKDSRLDRRLGYWRDQIKAATVSGRPWASAKLRTVCAALD